MDEVTGFSIYVRAFGPFFEEEQKYASKREIHGEQKSREVFTVPLSHSIGAQFQHRSEYPSQVISHAVISVSARARFMLKYSPHRLFEHDHVYHYRRLRINMGFLPDTFYFSLYM